MDRLVERILFKYLSKSKIDELEKDLRKDSCIIYHSILPKITEQSVPYIDATPNREYPIRILEAYRKQCDCKWSDTSDGGTAKNPMLEMMNEQCDERAKILDKVIEVVRKLGE